MKIRLVRNPTPLIRLKQPSNFPRSDFVCGDEVYGLRTELREYLKDQDQSYCRANPPDVVDI